MKILEVIRRPRIGVVLTLVLAINGVMAWQRATRVPDPVVNGRRLSEHLASIRVEGFRPIGKGIQNNVRYPFLPEFMEPQVLSPDVVAALENAGEKSHPMLVQMLHARASRLAILLDRSVRRASVRFPQLKHFVSAERGEDIAWYQQARAALALRQLGPRAQGILPEILPLLKDPDRGPVAAMAVLYLRPEREEDILQLTNRLRITRLPVLVSVPESTDWINASTLLVLATFGEKARGAGPVLIPFLASSNGTVRGSAALALAASRVEPDVVVPKLIHFLSNSLPITSGSSSGLQDSTPVEMLIEALGTYGAEAAPAIPILEAYARTEEFERFVAAKVLTKVRAAVERGRR